MSIRYRDYRSSTQQDASDFLRHFLDSLIVEEIRLNQIQLTNDNFKDIIEHSLGFEE